MLAIEPMVNMGKPAVRVLSDGWTAVTKDGQLSAHFEHTVAVTDGRAAGADGARRAGGGGRERLLGLAAGRPFVRKWRVRRPDPRAVEGVVVAQLPSALYRVNVNGREVTAHLTGDARRNFIRVLVGDRVTVMLAPGDLTRGRIVGTL